MSDTLRLAGAETARDENFIEQIKTALALPRAARVELQTIAQDARGEWNVEYAVTVPIEIRGAEFGVANQVMVDERVIATLRFDAHGALVTTQVTPIDDQHLRSVQAQIKKLAAADQIYAGDPIDPGALRAQSKPWYIETDARGFKRLKRAYIA